MAEWKKGKLVDLAREITVGYVGPMTQEYVPGGIPFLRSQNVEPLSVNSKDLKFISPSFHKRIKKSALSPGDVVIVRTGKPGSCALVPDWLSDANCSDLVIVRCGPALKAQYLVYYINSVAGHHVDSHTVGAVQQHFNVGAARTLEINLPPLPEQEAIAEVLSSLDDKIDLLHRQNQTLEQMAEALFRQWYEECGERDDTSLGEEFSITMGQSPPGESYNEEGNGIEFYQGSTDFGFRFPTPRVYTTQPGRMAQKFDTLISVRAPVGEVNMAFGDCCLGRGVGALRHPTNSHSFTFYLVKSLQSEFEGFNSEGTVFGAVNKAGLSGIAIKQLPITEIQKVESILAPFDQKILTNTLQIRTLTQTRDALLPKLMSGEVRVL